MQTKELTKVELNSPYGYLRVIEAKTNIPNGTPGFVHGKINPTKGNLVLFQDYEQLEEVRVPAHWLTVTNNFQPSKTFR